MRTLTLAMFAVALSATPILAQDMSAFTAGPVFSDYGKVAKIDSDLPVTSDTQLKVILNAKDGAGPGEVVRAFESAARFINMNVAAGVPEKNIHVVLVVHGKATWNLTNAAAYARHDPDHPNASAPLVEQLLNHGVTIYLCGQSAAANGIAKSDLLPGVKLSLSAMNAFAQLQPQGYVLIP
ncbi:DsrE family protein [Novosphingobium album (ex Hu et al. 2023)]|uniref:DsrE family protein n=1 Tax=Novosphingobium album (ex Hu et al. 2023) TaxID=2930093 RepID=A0ABT0B124_9SPHN|nr:DsrE family protein [Novosphingobium album (ex Hu et al. 2023)]MCJ2178621.1 DsrE family protein [Novosphingobium album (ex Hu et al. 2023)]